MGKFTIHDQRENNDGLDERGFAVAENGAELAEFPGYEAAKLCRRALELGMPQADAIRQAGPTVDEYSYEYIGTAVNTARRTEVDAGKWGTPAEVRDATKAALAEAQGTDGGAYAFVERLTFYRGERVGYDVVPVYA